MVRPQRRGQRRGRHHALDAVDALRRELTDRGIVFTLARVKRDLLADLTAYGLTDTVGTERIFPTLQRL